MRSDPYATRLWGTLPGCFTIALLSALLAALPRPRTWWRAREITRQLLADALEQIRLFRPRDYMEARLAQLQAFNTETTKIHGAARRCSYDKSMQASFSRRAWKLNSRASRRPLMRRQVRTWASCADTILLTALISTIGCRSTRISNPALPPNRSRQTGGP